MNFAREVENPGHPCDRCGVRPDVDCPHRLGVKRDPALDRLAEEERKRESVPRQGRTKRRATTWS